MSTAELLRTSEGELRHAIATFQLIQKTNPPDTLAWQAAAGSLRPMFAEMARRERAGVLAVRS